MLFLVFYNVFLGYFCQEKMRASQKCTPQMSILVFLLFLLTTSPSSTYVTDIPFMFLGHFLSSPCGVFMMNFKRFCCINSFEGGFFVTERHVSHRKNKLTFEYV